MIGVFQSLSQEALCSFLIDLAYPGKINFGLSVVGKEAVDLLLYVCELRVAEALYRSAAQEGFYEDS
jgi:hypothetical protein